MRRIFFLILLLSPFINGCNHVDNNVHLDKSGHHGFEVKIKIPTEWIEKIRHFDYTRNNKALLHEFEGFIKPDTIYHPDSYHVDKDYGRMLSAMFVNLDGEPSDELICFLGWDVYLPYLCVFKEMQGTWYLIYMEDVDTFYSSPTLYVANNFSQNKTFYFKHVDGHGSGFYADSYSFYKLINNKVYKCLDLANERGDYGPRPYVSRELEMSFEFNGDENDGIWVNYKYNFSSNIIDKKDCSSCANNLLPLINGEVSVGYKWDNKSHTYKLDVQQSQSDINDLTTQKVGYFNNVNDTLFVSAFKGQINEILKTGAPLQKKVLHQYLDMVEKGKKNRK